MKKPIIALQGLDMEITLGCLRIKVVSLVDVPAEPSWHVTNHSHTDFELHVIPSGQGIVEIEGNCVNLKPNDVYITGPFVNHMQKSFPTDPMREYCLECEISIDEKKDTLSLTKEESVILLESLSKTYEKAYNNSEIVSLFEEVFEEDKTRDTGFYIKIQLLILNILMTVFRQFAFEYKTRFDYTSSKKTNEELRITKLINFIKANYRKDILLKDVEKTLFLTTRQINRLMMKKFNCTFHEYLSKYRIGKAKKLLEKTDMPIEQVAFESGFSSHYYMYQVFKKENIGTPLNYRKSSTSK
ncbi:MAG TPA: AraC family transcriptional regulator [Clostridia bacterium]|nr:MAG: Melibiose operon regulatory protein [Firmicutes bacterium ADurb.Bin146]HOD92893.1 AraC family transcriptional regulator [Clostridia bacterium]HQM39143.1 AraC family transcriptional regulator [Clostridia bacterium]